MGENVKRLTMIDAEKYNSLITMLQEATQRQKILEDSTRTPAAAELVESQAEMVRSVKGKSTLASANIVNYMKKKAKYLDEVGQQRVDGEPPPAAAAAAAGAAVGVGTVAYHTQKITNHFKTKAITNTGKGLSYGGKSFNLNYEDVMQDLTHNYKANKMNLSLNEQEATLRILRRSKMPASYIRNKILHDKYTNLLQTPKATPITTPPPAYQTATPRGRAYAMRGKRVFGQQRPYMQGYLDATGAGSST
jgi:hypothetical protein